MKFTIETHRTLEEVRMLLQSVTALRDGLSYASFENKTFMGTVGEDQFKMMLIPERPLHYDTSLNLVPGRPNTTLFWPVIVGHIQTRENGTVVEMYMRLIPLACAWASVWFCLLGVCFFGSLLELIMGEPEGWQGVAVVGAIILGSLLLVKYGFHIPAEKARQKLEELLGDGE